MFYFKVSQQRAGYFSSLLKTKVMNLILYFTLEFNSLLYLQGEREKKERNKKRRNRKKFKKRQNRNSSKKEEEEPNE